MAMGNQFDIKYHFVLLAEAVLFFFMQIKLQFCKIYATNFHCFSYTHTHTHYWFSSLQKIYFLYFFFLQIRVKRNSLMNCLKVRDFGSSFPVRYIPKNSPKIQKLQTSFPPMNDLEDKNKQDGLDQNFEKVESSDGVKVLGGRYIPKKTVKTEKWQTSSQPMNDFEDKDKHTDSLDCGKVVGRSYIPNKSVKTEKSETSSAPMNDFEDNDKHNGSDHNVERVESSNGGKVLGRSYIPKKPVKTELETSSLPMNDFDDKVKHDISDSNKLRVKNLDGRKNVVRSYAIGKKLNQNKLPRNNLIFNNGPGFILSNQLNCQKFIYFIFTPCI